MPPRLADQRRRKQMDLGAKCRSRGGGGGRGLCQVVRLVVLAAGNATTPASVMVEMRHDDQQPRVLPKLASLAPVRQLQTVALHSLGGCRVVRDRVVEQVEDEIRLFGVVVPGPDA